MKKSRIQKDRTDFFLTKRYVPPFVFALVDMYFNAYSMYRAFNVTVYWELSKSAGININFIQRKGTQKAWSLYKVVQMSWYEILQW